MIDKFTGVLFVVVTLCNNINNLKKEYDFQLKVKIIRDKFEFLEVEDDNEQENTKWVFSLFRLFGSYIVFNKKIKLEGYMTSVELNDSITQLRGDMNGANIIWPYTANGKFLPHEEFKKEFMRINPDIEEYLDKTYQRKNFEYLEIDELMSMDR